MRIKDLEVQLSYMQDDSRKVQQENMEKLAKINELQLKITSLEEKNREIEVWKARCTHLQTSQTSEIEDLKRQYDATLQHRLVNLIYLYFC